MTLQIADIKSAVDATPALKAELFSTFETDFTTHLTDPTGKGMILATKDDFASDRQKLIDDTTKGNHTAWEKALEAVFGPKPKGVKGLDWVADLVTKGKFTMNDQNPPAPTPDSAAQNQALTQMQEELKNLKTELATEKKAVFAAKVSTSVSTGIEGLNLAIPSHIKADDTKAAFLKDERAAKAAFFNATYKPEALTDGRIVFKDAAGTALVDNSGNPLSVSEIIAQKHAHWLAPTGHSQGGTGSAQQQPGLGDPDYKGATSDEIIAKLAEDGLVMGSLAWTEAFKKAHAKAGVALPA